MLLVCPPVEALREWLERADIKTGRSSGRSTDGTPWRRAHPVDQSGRQAALRHGGVGAGGVFRRTDVAPNI